MIEYFIMSYWVGFSNNPGSGSSTQRNEFATFGPPNRHGHPLPVPLGNTFKEKTDEKAAIWLCFLLILAPAVPAGAADGLICWFPPDWTDMDRAHEITDALSQGSGYMVQPRRADSYPQILESITSGFPCLVYAGSFVQSVITFRQLAEPLVQAIDGRELYGCTMIFRHGDQVA